MDTTAILTICFLSFIISAFSVSVGGTSLITVPLLISMGMVSKNAVATNMFALIFLSISGIIGFRKEMKPMQSKMFIILFLLTVCGSLIGANLVLAINKDILKKVIAIMVCFIAISIVFKKNWGVEEKKHQISAIKFVIAGLLIFLLSIYGGFFSGGYVMLLGYVFISIFGFNFLQTAFVTKILKVFSALAACVFFYYHNLIDFKVGMPMAISMFFGGFLGSKLAIAKGNVWIRNIFIATAIALAIKLLLF